MKKLKRWLKWPVWVTFPLIFAMFAWHGVRSLDPDFGWHLKAGEHFVQNGVPKTDVFTYTASDFPWVDHEWLSDILVYLIHEVGGYVLLALVFAALWTLALWLVGRRALGPVVAIAALAALPYSGVRAITWSVLGLALVIKIFAAKNQRWRWIMPILIMLWANVHGGFIVGLGYIAYQAIMKRSGPLVLIGLISLCATLVNVYGLEIYTEIWRTMADRSLHTSIVEWKSLVFSWSLLPFLVLYGVGWLYEKGKWYWRAVRIENFFLLASISAQRNWPLFAVAALERTSDSMRTIARTIPAKLKRAQRNVLLAIGIGFAGLTAYGVYDTGILLIGSSDGESYPSAAVDYLREHPCPGNLFNDYNYGGYLIWQLPQQKVYIDGRMPSWELNGEKYMENYSGFLDDESERDKQIDKYDIQCILVSNRFEPLIKDLSDSGKWRTVIEQDDYTLMKR